MSRRPVDTEHRDPRTSLPRILRNWTKSLRTASFAEVMEYDPRTRRAKIKGAVQEVLEDGTPTERPMVAEVPVIWGGGAGLTTVGDLEKGDMVLVVYAQQGIGGWKKKHETSPADVDGLLDEKDAIAVPWTGPGPDEPIEQPSRGWTVMSLDPDNPRHIHLPKDEHLIQLRNDETTAEIGQDFVAVDVAAQGSATVNAPQGTITLDNGSAIARFALNTIDLTASTINLNGNVNMKRGHVQHDGTNIGKDHNHQYTLPLHSGGSADTGPPM